MTSLGMVLSTLWRENQKPLVIWKTTLPSYKTRQDITHHHHHDSIGQWRWILQYWIQSMAADQRDPPRKQWPEDSWTKWSSWKVQSHHSLFNACCTPLNLDLSFGLKRQPAQFIFSIEFSALQWKPWLRMKVGMGENQTWLIYESLEALPTCTSQKTSDLNWTQKVSNAGSSVTVKRRKRSDYLIHRRRKLKSPEMLSLGKNPDLLRMQSMEPWKLSLIFCQTLTGKMQTMKV